MGKVDVAELQQRVDSLETNLSYEGQVRADAYTHLWDELHGLQRALGIGECVNCGVLVLLKNTDSGLCPSCVAARK